MLNKKKNVLHFYKEIEQRLDKINDSLNIMLKHLGIMGEDGCIHAWDVLPNEHDMFGRPILKCLNCGKKKLSKLR